MSEMPFFFFFMISLLCFFDHLDCIPQDILVAIERNPAQISLSKNKLMCVFMGGDGGIYWLLLERQQE